MLPGSTPRRDFLKLVGLAGLSSSIVAPMRALAQAAKGGSAADSAKAGAPAMAAPDTSTAEAPKPPSEDALALTMIVRRRYGEHLDADQLKAITDELDFRIQSGERLKAAKLTNGDEPDVTFRA